MRNNVDPIEKNKSMPGTNNVEIKQIEAEKK